MKQNDFRGIAMAVLVFALGTIAVGFTGCDFLEDFVKMQVAEEPLITDSFSGASTEDEVVDSVIDMIRAAKDEPSLTLKLAAMPDEPVDVEDSAKDIYEGLVLSTVNYKLHSKLGYIAQGHDRWDDDNDPISEGLAGDEHLANSPAKVIIDGKGRTIALTGTNNTVQMPLITVGEGVTLELRNITFKGMDPNYAPLILVRDKGTLIMQSGTYLKGNNIKLNTTSSLTLTHGGGVHVGAGGTFIMWDGTISGNTVRASKSTGGGVAVYGGTFTMKGGIISDNISSSKYGGGVSVANSGTFIMEGGFIEHNNAEVSGGGVFINSSNFTKTGGTIYGTKKEDGSAENSDKINTANTLNGDPGSAVHLVYNSSNTMIRETTAGTEIDLHYPLQDEDGNPLKDENGKDLPNNWGK
ncbi:MAG: right-handed parallel beta-helix repeat-containing protein [Spirochaetaceae bacterium]|jgi:hypothetical protein|nr:right-handed parallel beta-helix repeat-containing protein [Spirochaetaceae bacterium]